MIADHRRLAKALVFAYEDIVTRFGEAYNNSRFCRRQRHTCRVEPRRAWRSVTIARYFFNLACDVTRSIAGRQWDA